MLDIFNTSISSNQMIYALLEKLTELEQSGVIIQAQPLGMMRIALDGQQNAENGKFLHYWAADLPKSMENPPLHTHVFNMRSRIIVGKITDTTFKITHDIDGMHQLIQAKCTQDYCAMVSSIQRVRVDTECIRELKAGDIYKVAKDVFHVTSFDSKNDVAITVMEKSDVDKSDPLLIIPYSTNEVDLTPFDRTQLDQKGAWERIKKTLSDALI